MYKIAMIGERDSVLGFMALGFSVREAADVEEARRELHRLAKDPSVAVIFLVENYAAAMEEDVAKYKDQPMPAVIAIPGRARLDRIRYGKHQDRGGTRGRRGYSEGLIFRVPIGKND